MYLYRTRQVQSMMCRIKNLCVRMPSQARVYPLMKLKPTCAICKRISTPNSISTSRMS